MLDTLLWNLLLTAGLAVLLAVLCRLPWLQRRPAFVHWLWLLLLVKLVTPPLIPVPVLPAVDGREETATVASLPSTPRGQVGVTLDEFTAIPVLPEMSLEHSEVPTTESPSAFFSAEEPVLAAHDGAVPPEELVVGKPSVVGLMILSLAGTCVLLAFHGVHAVKFNRWLKRAGTADSTLAESCENLASRMGIGGNLRACVVETRTTPLLWAWRRPIVAVPRQLVDELKPGQLRSILAHELAHLVRRDHWANLFVCFVKALTWWNPVVWWADRELRVAQEMCCDAIAIERCNVNRSSYAATLLKTLDFIQPPVASSRLALGMGSRGTILRRFEMIGERGLTYRTSRWAILGLLVIGTALTCMPVRGQEEETPAEPAPTASEADAAVAPAETSSDKDEKAEDAKSIVEVLGEALGKAIPGAQRERAFGNRPRGNCSISGRVVSAETGKPVNHATVYLFHIDTNSGMFVKVASDGTFVMKDIPTGPFSLTTTNTSGYQDSAYNPERQLGLFPQFSLEEGEHRSDVIFRINQACQISGKVLDEQGKVPECIDQVNVLAWFKTPGGDFRNEQALVDRKDGSFSIDGLDKKPVYVMAINWKSDETDNVYPPIYYPSTFNRDDAKQITFDDGCKVENVDITLTKKGGLVLEGTVTDESGKPVPEAFVVVHRRDMLFDFVTDYTDENGKYRIPGLGRGKFLVHVDAAHRGFVRIRTPFELDGSVAETQRDFTLPLGVTISGKFVDEEGKEWRTTRSHGHATTNPNQLDSQSGSFSLSRFRNKFGPKDVSEYSSGSFCTGEGSYHSRHMVFPTPSTFLIQGMMPGWNQFTFLPKEKEGRAVRQILLFGNDIKESGIETKAGQKVEDVTIVIGKRRPGETASGAMASRRITLPQGDCSLGGRVVSTTTSEPISQGAIQLHHTVLMTSIFTDLAEDGTFLFEDIPTGPYSLRTTRTTGYQSVNYNPDGIPDYLPQFTLDEGEQRLDLVLRAQSAYRVSGKIRDAEGKVPDDCQELTVWAWGQKGGRSDWKRGTVDPADGSFTIDGLDGRPVFLVLTNWQAQKEGRHFPSVYYPSTFSRNEARRIEFDGNHTVENVDIILLTEGGLTLEGVVVDEQDEPVPEAFVSVNPPDVHVGRSATYTDAHGRYQIRGLGDGDFLVHVDAAHRGYARTRVTVHLDDANQETTRDFTLTKGVLISGKLVDKAGNDWEIARSFGSATVGDEPDEDSTASSFYGNKFASKGVGQFPRSSMTTGEGGYSATGMIFPTKSTFAVHGATPGLTRFDFRTAKIGQEVLEIRYKDRDLLESGLETKPGETIEHVIIVIGEKEDDG